jgi:competence protein ComER
MNIGIIGIGTMGSMLAQTWLHAGTVPAEQMMILNRTPQKAFAVAERWPGVRVGTHVGQIADQCEIVFLCIKPLEYRAVLEELRPLLNEQQIVVSITSPVMIAQLEALLPAKIVKLIPSITNSLQAGIALYACGSRIADDDREQLLRLFRALGSPLEIEESLTRIASDMSSCGPAFVSLLLDQWAGAANRCTGMPLPMAQTLLSEMLLGCSRLLTAGGLTPAEIMKKVAVPGGITAAGLAHLQTQTDTLFDELTALTHEKFVEDCHHVAAQCTARSDD